MAITQSFFVEKYSKHFRAKFFLAFRIQHVIHFLLNNPKTASMSGSPLVCVFIPEDNNLPVREEILLRDYNKRYKMLYYEKGEKMAKTTMLIHFF